MAITYLIDPRERLVYLTVTGKSPFDEWEGVLRRVLADPAYGKGFNFLTDRRRQRDIPGPDFPLRVLRLLMSHTSEMGRFRWAAVTPWQTPFGTLRMFSILAEEADIHVEAFGDYEEAQRWLLGVTTGGSAACTYKILPEERVVYLTVSEGAPFTAFGNALRSALADPAYRPGFNFLSDCSRMTSLPDPSQLRLAADFFMLLPPEGLGKRYRWAMVASNSALQGMQSAFGGVLEASWGAQTKVFMDAEEAQRWLLSEGTAANA